jgi:hypothetical protein
MSIHKGMYMTPRLPDRNSWFAIYPDECPGRVLRISGPRNGVVFRGVPRYIDDGTSNKCLADWGDGWYSRSHIDSHGKKSTNAN